MNILLATDGSRYATEAASFLRMHLDPSAGIRISLVAVLEGGNGLAATGGSHRHGDDPAKQQMRANAWLDRTREVLGDALAPVRSAILRGPPEDVLVREARQHDLVVAGVKGSGAAPFFELGRVARSLLRHADCSVLLVRNRRSGGGDLRDGKGTEGVDAAGFMVLLPTAAQAGDSLPVGWGLLQPFALSRATVEVVTVLDPVLRSSRPSRDGSATPQPGDPREGVRRWLAHTAGRLRAPGGEPRCALLEGRPGSELERHALDTRADLIVVGARRGDSPGAGPLGSTARELSWRAPCSVLTVRHRPASASMQVDLTPDLGTGIPAQAQADA